MNFNKKIIISALSIASFFGFSACNKSYLDTKPSNQVVLEDVFTTTQGARSVINGAIRSLFDSNDHDEFGIPSLGINYDLMGEDFNMTGTGAGWFVSAARYSRSRDGDAYSWSLYYGVINNCNFVLKYIDAADGSETEKHELKGQAYALRSWAYFQLIQLHQFAFGSDQYIVAPASSTQSFGDVQPGASITQALGVPVYTEPTKVGNPRASMQTVIDRITTDIDSSLYNFEQGVSTRSDKSQVNINVAHGIKARVSLYLQRWNDAATHARAARQGVSLMSQGELLGGFNNAANGEWIWGLIINQEQNGIYASFMSHMDPKLKAYGAMAQKVVTLGLIYKSPASTDIYQRTIDSTDIRKRWWNPPTGTLFYPDLARRSQMKFFSQGANSFLADYPLMRASEMYLIEAEALAMTDLTAATAVLNEFALTRDPQFTSHTNLNIGTRDLFVHEVWRQRRIELWGEGFRFFDVKRQMVNRAGVVAMPTLSRAGGVNGNQNISLNANDPALCFRIPGSETIQNTDVIQNP